MSELPSTETVQHFLNIKIAAGKVVGSPMHLCDPLPIRYMEAIVRDLEELKELRYRIESLEK